MELLSLSAYRQRVEGTPFSLLGNGSSEILNLNLFPPVLELGTFRFQDAFIVFATGLNGWVAYLELGGWWGFFGSKTHRKQCIERSYFCGWIL